MQIPPVGVGWVNGLRPLSHDLLVTLRQVCCGLRSLSRREHATDDLPRLLYRDVVGYGAGGGLGQDGVGVAEEGVLLVLVFVFDAEGASYESEDDPVPGRAR